MAKITIFTDGGCMGYHDKDAVGAWAFVSFEGYDITSREYKITDSQYALDTTNNRMELMAVIKAVRWAKKHYGMEDLHIRLYSDSGYVVKGINDPSYSKKWMHNGWVNSKKKPVENKDLWVELIGELLGIDITLINIRGHGKNKDSDQNYHNDQCDVMCTAQIQRYMNNRDNQ